MSLSDSVDKKGASSGSPSSSLRVVQLHSQSLPSVLGPCLSRGLISMSELKPGPSSLLEWLLFFHFFVVRRDHGQVIERSLARRTLRNHDAWFHISISFFSLLLFDIATPATCILTSFCHYCHPHTSCLSRLEAKELFSSL